MPRNRIVRLLACVLLWPAAALVYPQMQGLVAYLLWWMASQSGATNLSRSVFAGDAWLTLAALDGFLLGLIPLDNLRRWAASSTGYLSYRPASRHAESPHAWRPELWAWVLPAIVFLIRFFTFDTHDQTSVFGLFLPGESRWGHFFGAPPPLSFETLALFKDRILLTSPMLLLLAYPCGVRLREGLGKRRLVAQEFQTATLIHSAPDLNPTETTEIPAQHGPLE